MTKFQIFSDIHLSEIEELTKEKDKNAVIFYDFEKVFPKASADVEILFLAGDVGQITTSDVYEEFFDYVSSNWKYVFYVLGNNEYYVSQKLSLPYFKVLEMYKTFFKERYRNVHLLEKETILLPVKDNDEDDGEKEEGTRLLRIIGCTLWSFASEETVKHAPYAFSKILDKKLNPLSYQEYNKLNNDSVSWLSNALDPKNERGIYATIILTHYPTIQENTSHPKYEKTQTVETKNLFANNLSHLLTRSFSRSRYHKKIFISGHTHYSFEFKDSLTNSFYVSNQFGHRVLRDEEKEANFKADKIFCV